MKIAALIPYKATPMRGIPPHRVLEAIAPVVDRVIFFNDASFPERWQQGNNVEVLCSLRMKPEWHDYANRLALLARATAYECDWVLWVDDDWTFPGITRERLFEQISRADAEHRCGVNYSLREMWDEKHYRSDGIWKEKRRTVLQKNSLSYRGITWRESHLQPLHAMPLPASWNMLETDCEVLHWGMCSPYLRKQRVDKHNKLDPDKKWQQMGYDYMIDETGIELTPI